MKNAVGKHLAPASGGGETNGFAAARGLTVSPAAGFGIVLELGLSAFDTNKIRLSAR